ncbi:hypothetical protein ACSMXM_04725 [Pacificimonas sp. ICDLI1SI03]
MNARFFLPALTLLAACSAQEPGAEPTDEAVRAASTGPGAVVEAYYAAISSRDYATAWQLWGQEPEEDTDAFERFKSGFTDTELTAVEIGRISPHSVSNGVATVSVDVEVDDLLSDGTGRSYDGIYRLRRPVDGTGDWHIVSGDLGVVPARD